jgi:hypothetical protein
VELAGLLSNPDFIERLTELLKEKPPEDGG